MKRPLLLFLTGCLLLSAGCVRPIDIPSEGSSSAPGTGYSAADAVSTSSTFSLYTGSDATQSPLQTGSGTSGNISSSTGGTTASRSDSTATSSTGTSASPTTPPVETDQEMRAVWVSYIELNKLLSDSSTPDKARAALDTLMDNCVSYGMNAVIFHVRANSDAYYKSSLFLPASSAKKLLEAGFDPLEYAVSAAHKHGLELHAWINPYRIGANKAYAIGSEIFTYNGRYYYIPTSLEAQKIILDGVKEVVNNYAIDGVQYDDYFYPTGCIGENEVADFEKEAYDTYKSEAGNRALSPGAWRRSHVDALMAASYQAVHKRTGAVFGVSPSHDSEKTYSKMFADTKKWLAQRGYIDYLCPQVYFGFEHISAAFDKVVNQWLAFPRDDSVKLYFGIGIYKIGLSPDRYAGSASNPAGRYEWQERDDIMKRSVQYLRTKSAVEGMMFYSYSFFDENTHRSLSSWEEGGRLYQQDYEPAIAKREVENLLPLLR